MQCGAIDLGINDDGGDAHLAAGAYDAHRDLSPISDQNLLEHLRSDLVHPTGRADNALILPAGMKMCVMQITRGCVVAGFCPAQRERNEILKEPARIAIEAGPRLAPKH